MTIISKVDSGAGAFVVKPSLASKMWRSLDRARRVIATGLSFLSFGAGGLVMGILVFPALNITMRDESRRRRAARRVVQRAFAFHIGLMRGLGVLTYEIRGGERLQRDGLLILANHPALLDVVFLVSLLPNADCVVKAALARNPFTRGPVRAAGYICNADGAGLVDDCIAAVRRGGNLVIFPEGTRSRRDGELKLQRGAANIAVRGRLDITPVLLHYTPLTLGKGDRWYRVPARRFHVVVDIHPDIGIAPFTEGESGEALAARRLTDHLTRYFATGGIACNHSNSKSRN